MYTDVIAMHFLAPVADYFSKLKTIICMFISLSYFGFKYFSYLNEHIENLIKGVHLKGTVMEINEGAVNSEVIIDVGDGNTIVSSITKESVFNLGLKVGSEATAVIKAATVMLMA